MNKVIGNRIGLNQTGNAGVPNGIGVPIQNEACITLNGTTVRCHTAFVTTSPGLGQRPYSREFSRSSCGLALPLVIR